MVILIGYCYIYMYKCNAFLTTIIDEGRDFVIDYLQYITDRKSVV